jgi:hypothetical protein
VSPHRRRELALALRTDSETTFEPTVAHRPARYGNSPGLVHVRLSLRASAAIASSARPHRTAFSPPTSMRPRSTRVAYESDPTRFLATLRAPFVLPPGGGAGPSPAVRPTTSRRRSPRLRAALEACSPKSPRYPSLEPPRAHTPAHTPALTPTLALELTPNTPPTSVHPASIPVRAPRSHPLQTIPTPAGLARSCPSVAVDAAAPSGAAPAAADGEERLPGPSPRRPNALTLRSSRSPAAPRPTLSPP